MRFHRNLHASIEDQRDVLERISESVIEAGLHRSYQASLSMASEMVIKLASRWPSEDLEATVALNSATSDILEHHRIAVTAETYFSFGVAHNFSRRDGSANIYLMKVSTDGEPLEGSASLVGIASPPNKISATEPYDQAALEISIAGLRLGYETGLTYTAFGRVATFSWLFDSKQ